jgi:hypothetical protein
MSLTCPLGPLNIIDVMNNTNYAHQIINNLEKKGESKDYIIGFLTATIDGLKYIDNQQVIDYLQRSVKQTQPTH